MYRCLFTLTLVLAGLAAARANAQAPGLSPRVNLSAPGPMAPILPWVGARNPGAAGQPWCSEIYVDPDTGIVYAGTLTDKWPVWPITIRARKYDWQAFPIPAPSTDQTGPRGRSPGLVAPR